MINQAIPKKVIIIGASSGIGLELAKLYVAEGSRVAVTGRRCEQLESFRNQHPANVLTACFDVTGHSNIAFMESMIKDLGGLDLLIYAAGIGAVSESLDWTIDRATTMTNVNGFVEIVNYSYNYFVKQGKGQLAAISSIISLRGNSKAPAYSASKAFMSRYMEGLAIKAQKIKKGNGAGSGITVTDIRPGFVKTKTATVENLFWEAPVEKAAMQMYKAIAGKRRLVYITRRWALIAWLLKWIPYSLYKRFG